VFELLKFFFGAF